MKYEMSYIENGAIRIFKTNEFSEITNQIIKHDLHIADVELKEVEYVNNTFDVKQCRL